MAVCTSANVGVACDRESLKQFSAWCCLLINGYECPQTKTFQLIVFTPRENKACMEISCFPVSTSSPSLQLRQLQTEFVLCTRTVLFVWLVIFVSLFDFCFFVLCCQKSQKTSIAIHVLSIGPCGNVLKCSRTKLSSNHYYFQLWIHFYRNWTEGSW